MTKRKATEESGQTFTNCNFVPQVKNDIHLDGSLMEVMRVLAEAAIENAKTIQCIADMSNKAMPDVVCMKIYGG